MCFTTSRPPRDRFSSPTWPRAWTFRPLIVLEHNPRNWLAMRILSRHPFDRDAVFLRHEESVALLESAKLETRTDFIVFFPGLLRPLRFLESHCAGFRWPAVRLHR